MWVRLSSGRNLFAMYRRMGAEAVEFHDVSTVGRCARGHLLRLRDTGRMAVAARENEPAQLAS